jgi:hypothetical protein
MATMDLNWRGMLTTKNIEQVADLLHQLLEGKSYTFTAKNERFGFRPEVRWHLRLSTRTTSGKAINVWHDEQGRFAGFNVSDTYGVWTCDTDLKEDKFDPDFNNPYFVFEQDKVTITHRSGSGNLLCWMVAVEPD